MRRKRFIQTLAALSGFGSVIAGCETTRTIKGSITGASAAVGHLLRTPVAGEPTSIRQKDVVIVGAGVSGLSAAYHLQKTGQHHFVLLDLESTAGGNAASAKNELSAYPLGAHYIPVPNNNLSEYLHFLEEQNVITGYNENGLPVYNEYYLCFDPEERLYINGHWQEGLIPKHGVPTEDLKQIDRFLLLMDGFRFAKGNDGKDAFALPVNNSSTDEQYAALDALTMQEWLSRQSLDSTYLRWYIDYCTRDDFGTPINKVSAWAAIHYFACRKGMAANAHHSDVLTWPEGNNFLVKALQKPVAKSLLLQSLVVAVRATDTGVLVDYLDVQVKVLHRIEAKHCILAVPQFVAARLLKDEKRGELVKQHLAYVPWMVANIKVRKLLERSGVPMSWDNVVYGSPSLGYVQATHQFLQQGLAMHNLSYYLPLGSGDLLAERRAAQNRSYEEWVELVMNDLAGAHPDFREAVEEVNIHIWGHAMVQPVPHLIHGDLRSELAASIGNIHFAHTDLAGVSLFEEAFYQGLSAAQKVVKQPLVVVS